MADGVSDDDLAEVDAFLADAKTLVDGEPNWFGPVRDREMQAIWGIVESSGISRAELRFRQSSVYRAEPSVSLIFRRRLLWRVDIKPPQAWKPNPTGAYRWGLPPNIYGTHGHCWPDNRDWVRKNGFDMLPFRRQLPAALKRLPQAVAALAAEINLTLGPDQRRFDVPSGSGLFD